MDRRSLAVFAALAAACGSAHETGAEGEPAWECGTEPVLLLPLADGERAIVFPAGQRLVYWVVGGEDDPVWSTDRCGGDRRMLAPALRGVQALSDGAVIGCDGDALVDIDPTGAQAPQLRLDGVECESARETPHGLLVNGLPDGFTRPLQLDDQVLVPAVYDADLLDGGDALLAVDDQARVVRVDLATRAITVLQHDAVRVDPSPDGEAFVWQAFPRQSDVTPLYLSRDGSAVHLADGYTPLSPPYDEVAWTAGGGHVYIVGEFNDLVRLFDGGTGAVVEPPDHDWLGGAWPRGSTLSDGGVWLTRLDPGDRATELYWHPANGAVTELWSDAVDRYFNRDAVDVGDGLARLVRDDAAATAGTLWHWSFAGEAREVGSAGLYLSVAGRTVLSVVADGGAGPVTALDLDTGASAELDTGAVAIPAPAPFGDFVVYRKPGGMWAAPAVKGHDLVDPSVGK
jgi:hypothetical protein